MTSIDLTDPKPRRMIAILDGKPGMADELRALVVELGIQVREEPGLTFTVYQARDVAGRIYIYEIYANVRAFSEHLSTEHVKQFIARLPSVSPEQ